MVAHFNSINRQITVGQLFKLFNVFVFPPISNKYLASTQPRDIAFKATFDIKKIV